MTDKDTDKKNKVDKKSDAPESQNDDANRESSGSEDQKSFDNQVDFIAGETISDAEKQARLAQLEEEIKQTAEALNENKNTDSKDDSDTTTSQTPSDNPDEIDEEAIDAAVVEEQQRAVALLAARRESVREDDHMFSNMEIVDDDGSAKTEKLTCMNCKTPLDGPYCHECGQPNRHFIRFFPKVLWEMINEAFDLDSKIFRTLVPLFFKPGRLTMEYIAGRRARYVNPLRLYIITSILFFISISVFTNLQDNIVVTDGPAQGVKSSTLISDDTEPEVEETEDSQGLIQINMNKGEEERQEKRLKQAKKVLAELKEQQANGLPMPDNAIKQLEEAIADGVIEEDEISSIEMDDELSVTLDDGTKWHPETNPVKFDGWFSPENTKELNFYLWELKEKLYAVNEDPSELAEEIFNIIPQLMFVLLPIFALLLKIMYIFKKRYYMEHLIVALHSHCFIFLSGMLILFTSYLMDKFADNALINGGLSWVMIAIGIWIPINLLLQQKRIYAQGKIMTFLKFIIVGISYQFLMAMTAVAAFILGLIAL